MTFQEVRARFPVLERYAYLNAGSFGPLSRATLDAICDEQRQVGDEGRSGPAYHERVSTLRDRVRTKLAREIGVDPTLVALTPSTTAGSNIVLSGLSLRRDDEVVTTDVEHFGLIGPLVASGARISVARLLGQPAARAFDIVRAAVTPRTRLLALSHVVWITGQRIPVAELRAATGLPVLVDGAQSAGAIAVDASGFDFYTVSAQKWLCGPDATGALYVQDPERLRVAAPSYVGQERHDRSAPSFVPRPGAARFDSGWIPTPSLAGLDAALDDLPEWRVARAAEAARRCRRLLEEAGFAVVTAPGHSTLVTFRVPGNPTDLVASCYKAGVVVRDVPGTDMVRASCGYWTSDEDLARLLAVIRT